jgi:hypothetical protein
VTLERCSGTNGDGSFVSRWTCSAEGGAALPPPSTAPVRYKALADGDSRQLLLPVLPPAALPQPTIRAIQPISLRLRTRCVGLALSQLDGHTTTVKLRPTGAVESFQSDATVGMAEDPPPLVLPPPPQLEAKPHTCYFPRGPCIICTSPCSICSAKYCKVHPTGRR